MIIYFNQFILNIQVFVFLRPKKKEKIKGESVQESV